MIFRGRHLQHASKYPVQGFFVKEGSALRYSSTYIKNQIEDASMKDYPDVPFKSDVWPGLENTRTWTRGHVKKWDKGRGYGILVSNNDLGSPCGRQQYFCHWSNLSKDQYIPWLKPGEPVMFEIVEEDKNNEFNMVPRTHFFRNDFNVHTVKRNGRQTKNRRSMRAVNVTPLNKKG